jgi:hypothetical protein
VTKVFQSAGLSAVPEALSLNTSWLAEYPDGAAIAAAPKVGATVVVVGGSVVVVVVVDVVVVVTLFGTVVVVVVVESAGFLGATVVVVEDDVVVGASVVEVVVGATVVVVGGSVVVVVVVVVGGTEVVVVVVPTSVIPWSAIVVLVTAGCVSLVAPPLTVQYQRFRPGTYDRDRRSKFDRRPPWAYGGAVVVGMEAATSVGSTIVSIV